MALAPAGGIRLRRAAGPAAAPVPSESIIEVVLGQDHVDARQSTGWSAGERSSMRMRHARPAVVAEPPERRDDVPPAEVSLDLPGRATSGGDVPDVGRVEDVDAEEGTPSRLLGVRVHSSLTRHVRSGGYRVAASDRGRRGRPARSRGPDAACGEIPGAERLLLERGPRPAAAAGGPSGATAVQRAWRCRASIRSAAAKYAARSSSMRRRRCRASRRCSSRYRSTQPTSAIRRSISARARRRGRRGRDRGLPGSPPRTRIRCTWCRPPGTAPARTDGAGDPRVSRRRVGQALMAVIPRRSDELSEGQPVARSMPSWTSRA